MTSCSRSLTARCGEWSRDTVCEFVRVGLLTEEDGVQQAADAAASALLYLQSVSARRRLQGTQYSLLAASISYIAPSLRGTTSNQRLSCGHVTHLLTTATTISVAGSVYVMDTSLQLGFALCCHSNATRAPIANPPNNAPLGGSLYHAPKLHPRPCSSVGIRPRTDTQTRVTIIHFASSSTHAKYIK